MIGIKQFKNQNSGNIKMNCDKVVHKKLTEFLMINDAWITNNFTITCGKMGQGKTSLLTNLVRKVFNKIFENIYIIMPKNSRSIIKKRYFFKTFTT